MNQAADVQLPPPISVKLTEKTRNETKVRIILLALARCFIMGGYVLLCTLKVSVFDAFVGLKHQPVAKMWSLLVIFFLLMIYNYLVDALPRHQLFYVIGIFYTMLFLAITIGLNHSMYGMDGTHPAKFLGWLSFFAIESYGSLAVTLFWSFLNSVYTIKGAKETYGYIIAVSQVGSIIGPALVANNRYLGGIPPVFAVGSICPLLAAGVMFAYMRKYGFSDMENKQVNSVENGKKTGIFEGLRLFVRYPYVSGIFAISCLFEITSTIMDYEMLTLAREVYTNKEDFAAFSGRYGVFVNIFTLVFALGGSKFLFKTFRLRGILVSFPVCVLATVVLIYVCPTLNIALGGMIFVSALSYAINNPAKEMLYSVTTTDIKFKSKSWIDAFGGRFAKASGSGFNNAFNASTDMLLTYGSIVSISLSVLLVFGAFIMGSKCEQYQTSNFKVGVKQQDPKEVALTLA